MATIIKFPTRKPAAPVAQNATSCISGNTVIQFPGVAPAPEPVPLKPVRDAASADQKKAMIAKVHVALQQLQHLPGFGDDAYRFILLEHFGARSSTELDCKQLHELLLKLAELGFQSSNPYFGRRDYCRWGTAALLSRIGKLLQEKGRVEGKRYGMDYAEGILKRQSKGETTSFAAATPKQLRAVIAALYSQAKRKGRRVR